MEVQVKTESREDVWGLRSVIGYSRHVSLLIGGYSRFLNMLASLEALMTLGKCRELPVVGFVRGYMIVGVIVRDYGLNDGLNIQCVLHSFAG